LNFLRTTLITHDLDQNAGFGTVNFICLKTRDYLMKHYFINISFLLKLMKKNYGIGVPIIATYIDEDQLNHDNSGITFNNGAFMVYERLV